MRCRMRYRTGWTVFLFVFTLVGVFLTYRQLGVSNRKHNRYKSSETFFNPQEAFGNEFHQEGGPPKDKSSMDSNSFYPDNNQDVQGKSFQQNKVIVKEPADIHMVDSQSSRTIDRTLKSEILHMLYLLNPSDWGKAMDAIDMVINVKHILQELDIYSKMSCKDIDYLRVAQSVKISPRKFVDRAFVDNRAFEVIIKSQASDQDTKIKCMQSKYDVEKCQYMGNYNLLREIVLLSVLQHPTIIKMRGFCIRGDTINYSIRKKGIILVTEPGTIVNIGHLSSYAWKSKILYAIQLADLLKYLENSPLGSLGIGTIHHSDFVLVDQWIKLVDLDDLSFQEKTCQVEADCKITGASMYKIQCVNGHCVNRNAKQNLRTLGSELLERLLVNPPPSESDKVSKLRQKIVTLNITTSDLMNELDELKIAAEKIDSAQWRNPMPAGNAKVMVKPVPNELDNRRRQEINGNKILPMFGKANAKHDYIRVVESNFPGMNDYTCPASRVAWGCVITIRSLAQGKATCDADPICKAFVVFTSNPDASTLMTMVAKNSGSTKPEHNAGATLFIKGSEISPVGEKVGGGVPIPLPQMKEEEKPKPTKEKPLECHRNTVNMTSEARIARERRLMAHIGLKGFGDGDWEARMLTQKIVKAQTMRKQKSLSSIGGKMVVELHGMQIEKQFLRGIFLSESGPLHYHVAHMITYTLDRMLGLYHTPPTMYWSLTKQDIRQVKGDFAWEDLLDTQLSDVGTLTGLLTASKPRVIKEEHVSIAKLDAMTMDIVQFSRMEKMQLEYILLWYLTKTLHSKNIHLGYKGHLINFDADQAFQDTTVDLLEYFNHCQFPNVVYKAMFCFRCPPKSGQSIHSICALGEEAVDQVLDAGFDRPDVFVNHLDSKDIAAQINKAAANVLKKVDMCIKGFGREKVLY